MIERIYSEGQLSELPANGVEAQKIRALFRAYGGGYDFCRFFRQRSPDGSTYFSALDSSFVISGGAGADYAEIAQFLNIHGFSDVFCSEEAGIQLEKLLAAFFTRVDLMEYSCEKADVSCQEILRGLEISPSDIWKIIGTRFEIQFEPWYLDMSHRVRHGISTCFSDGKAALVMQHNINGEALLSQVCVLKEFEGLGYASRLLKTVCSAVPGKVQIVCENSLAAFYRKCGFSKTENKYVGIARH